MSTTASREEVLVTLASLVLALPDDAPRAVCLTGVGCSGKTTLAAELVEIVRGAGRPVVPVAYDDFHFPRERRHRQGRASAAGYLDDAFDPSSLRRLVLDPVAAGAPSIVVAAYDLALDRPLDPEPVPLPADGVVLVEGSFLLVPELAEAWDLTVMVVSDPGRVLDRGLVRDADLGTPDQVRELYLRRYLAAEAMHQERDDPWSRADVVVEMSDPASPAVLGSA
jgi:uridine kinase